MDLYPVEGSVGSAENSTATCFLTGQTALLWKVRKADMPTQKLTNELIAAAVEGYEVQKTSIDAKIAELRAMLPGGPAESAAASEAAPRKRKKFSAAARRKMAIAQKARWAKSKGESEPAKKTAVKTAPKRRLSAASRAKLIANLKKARAAKAAKKAAA